jgi:hypothetical protein
VRDIERGFVDKDYLDVLIWLINSKELGVLRCGDDGWEERKVKKEFIFENL